MELSAHSLLRKYEYSNGSCATLMIGALFFILFFIKTLNQFFLAVIIPPVHNGHLKIHTQSSFSVNDGRFTVLGFCRVEL